MQHTLHAGRQVPRARPPESRRPRSASVDVLGFSRAHSRARPPVGADVAHAAPARCALPRTCRALPSPGGRVCPCVRSAFSDTLSGDTRMGESNMNGASVQLSHLLGARQAVEPSYGSRGRPRLSARWATTVTQGLTTRDCDSRAGPWGGAGPPGWAFALLPLACWAGRFRGSPPGQGHREEGAGRITPEPSASARTGSEASATTGCPPPAPRSSRALLAVSLLVFFLIFKGRTCRCETRRTKSGRRQGSRPGWRAPRWAPACGGA